MTATPAKLRDGSWGARVPGKPAVGTAITVRTRSGKSWEAEVRRVLWSGTDRQTGDVVSLCATATATGSRSSSRTYTQECCWGPCPVSGRKCTPSDPCHDCQ